MDAIEAVLLPVGKVFVAPLIFDEVPKSALEGVRRRAPREFLSEVHEFSELVEAEIEVIVWRPGGGTAGAGNGWVEEATPTPTKGASSSEYKRARTWV